MPVPVPRVLIGEIPAYTEYILIKIPHGHVSSHAPHFSMILTDTYATVLDTAYDIICYVAVVEPGIDGNRMVGVESMCIGNIDVHVPAALRFQVGASHLKIPVPEQFPVGRQAVGLLEGCFCL